MTRITPTARPLAAAIVLALSTTNALAAGFSLPEVSIAGLATSNALVANPELLGAIPYNPSLAAFHPGTHVSGGLMVVAANSTVTTASPNAVASSDFQGKDFVPIPMLAATHQVNDRWTLGLSTTAPFGLSTNHFESSYTFMEALSPGSSPTKSAVEVVDIAPTATYKLNDSTAVAFGADVYWVKTVNFHTTGLENEGDGLDWGWNVSASHKSGPLTIGASYHSKSDVEIKGTTTVVAAGLTFPGTTAELTIPWRAQIGARYEFNDQLALEFDVSRTGWSSFDELAINTTPAGIVTSKNNWKNTNAYRLGGTYQIDDSLQLRFGYTYDKTGQPIEYFSARTADADRHLFSIGAEKKLSDGWAVEAGYMLVKFEDTTLSASGFTEAGEPNGSLFYNGKYETTVHLFGLGVSKSFDL